jgi:hypothetical protein
MPSCRARLLCYFSAIDASPVGVLERPATLNVVQPGGPIIENDMSPAPP